MTTSIRAVRSISKRIIARNVIDTSSKLSIWRGYSSAAITSRPVCDKETVCRFSKTVGNRIRTSFKFQNRRELSSSAASVDSDLSFLPEYQTASELKKQGNFAKAIPQYQRAYEILSNSIGQDSPLSIHVAFQLAKSYILSGQHDKAENILTGTGKNYTLINVYI
jgi:tetratricopeptide (TPR) repeat protein